MKIAVISDVHSNLMSLNMAIDDAMKECVDRFFFLGDYITDGEDGNKVLDVIKELSTDVILGNREKYVLDYTSDKRDYQNYRTISNTYDSLSIDNLKYIKELDHIKIININGFKILMLHGDSIGDLDNEINLVFDELIDMYDFDICLFGHSHKYFNKEYKNRRFINPGSIGIPSDYPTYKYCILDISDIVDVKLKEFRVKDTFDVFEEKYTDSFYYRDSPIWGSLVLNSIKEGRNHCQFFMDVFNNKVEKLGECDANNFNHLLAITYQDFCNNMNEVDYDLLNRIFMENKLFDIDSFFDFCKNNISDGWIDKEGNKHYQFNKDEYFLQSPLEVLENMIGMCFDRVELYRKFFSRFTMKTETYFLSYCGNDNCCLGHSIFVYYNFGKVYWFEPMFSNNYSGIFEYENIEELLEDFKMKFIESKLSEVENIDDNKFCLYRYTEPKYHIGYDEFYKYCRTYYE